MCCVGGVHEGTNILYMWPVFLNIISVPIIREYISQYQTITLYVHKHMYLISVLLHGDAQYVYLVGCD